MTETQRRRAPIGFGTREIYQEPLTLTARVNRAYYMDGLLSVGDGKITAVRVDGVPVEPSELELLCDGGLNPSFARTVLVPSGGLIEVDIAPTEPTPEPSFARSVVLFALRRFRVTSWLLYNTPLRRIRRRYMSVAAKGYVESVQSSAL
jgi:hypothetical protein